MLALWQCDVRLLPSGELRLRLLREPADGETPRRVGGKGIGQALESTLYCSRREQSRGRSTLLVDTRLPLGEGFCGWKLDVSAAHCLKRSA
jgi:hypothetical protein